MYLTTIAIIGSIIFIIVKSGTDILQKITTSTSISSSMKSINIWIVIYLIINLLLLIIILAYYFNRIKNKPIGRPGLKGFRGPKGEDAIESEL